MIYSTFFYFGTRPSHPTKIIEILVNDDLGFGFRSGDDLEELERGHFVDDKGSDYRKY